MLFEKLDKTQYTSFIVIAILLMIFSGCTFKSWKLHRDSVAHKFVPYSPPWLNTRHARGSFHIFKKPNINAYNNEQVGIFSFQPPSYAKGVGFLAATALYQRLLKYKIYGEVIPEINKGDLPLNTQVEIAKIKGYDLIITGKVKYYFDGSMVKQSRVDQQIKVIDIKTEEILWFIEVIEVGKPVYEENCRLFKIRGEEAPSTMELMAVASERLCKVLTWPHQLKDLGPENNIALNPTAQKK
jgi:hypothetical protein